MRSAKPNAAIAYLRDGVPGLSMADQEQLLRQAGIDTDQAYRDVLNPTQLRRREPGSLRQRARLLTLGTPPAPPAADPPVIHVAALRCLGWNVGDVARALADVSRIGASLHTADTDQTFTAAMLHVGLLDALAAVDETWRRGQTEDGRSAAAKVIATKAEAARRARIEAARPLWAKPSGEISAIEIANRVGISLRTLNKWLGPRAKARAGSKTPG